MSIDSDPQDLDLATRAQIDGVSFLLALFVDLTGKPCAKLVPVEAAEALQRDGVGFAGFAVGAIGQRPDDPDLIAIPDPAAYMPVPWIRADLALVHCDPHVGSRPWPFAPRVILQAVLARARGLFEQNFTFADALTTADRVVTARYLISVLAERRGMTATFMPQPFTDRTGNGLHLHLSLWRDGEALFPEPSDARGLGLSKTAYAFLAGVLEHACGLQAVIAPTVNSYKRTGASAPRSGATWSPRSATYGGNDRTHLLRGPDGDRIELVATARPTRTWPRPRRWPPVWTGWIGTSTPATPAAGTACIRRSRRPSCTPSTRSSPTPVVSGALDAAGPGVCEYFAAWKREEFLDWHAAVSPAEVERYLTAF